MAGRAQLLTLVCVLISLVHLQQATGAEQAAAKCLVQSSETTTTPTCSLEETASSNQHQQQPALTLAIRVSYADCTPASGADVTTSLRDKACVGVTSDDGYYVTSTAAGSDRWRIVSVRVSAGGGKGQVETQTIVFIRQVGDKLFVKARGSASDGSVSVSEDEGGNYTAVVHIVLLQNETVTDGKPGDVTKRSWDDESMAWLKKRNWDDESMAWLKKRSWDDESMAWLKKRGWDDESMAWLKKRGWDDESMAWLKKRGWDDESIAWLKKRSWDDESIAWLKKRSWDDESMAWLKKRGWDDESMAWLKRNWDDDTMSWIKRSSSDSKVKVAENNKAVAAAETAMHGDSSSSSKSSEEEKPKEHHEQEQKEQKEEEEEEKGKGRDKKWDDDSMQWIKRGEADAEVTAHKRKPTQNTQNVRERPGASSRSRFHKMTSP